MSQVPVSNNPRALAAAILTAVAGEGRSLSSQIPARLDGVAERRDRALVQELCYGTLRWYPRLQALCQRLLDRPLKPRDRDIGMLLLIGLYQLLYLDIPAHAAIHATVEAARLLGKRWAAGLVNAVLRHGQRRSAALLAELDRRPEVRWAHPEWLLTRLQQDWPDHWQSIADANNQRPPLSIRVNTRRCTVADYRRRLAEAGLEAEPLPGVRAGLRLVQPVAVDALPGFKDGWVSVQDGAAQRAAELLAVEPGQRVLDACAAPGGKTAHILELQPALEELVAVDIEAQRLRRVEENLSRLGLVASLVAADAARPAQWWDGRAFQRILLDAPCSATGVIRRHPDIKLLRRGSDVDHLAEKQRLLLDTLWPLLAPGGMLLYVTCSVLRRENSEQLVRFITTHDDARALALDVAWGHAQPVGRQILPGEEGMDGFYFACVSKRQT